MRLKTFCAWIKHDTLEVVIEIYLKTHVFAHTYVCTHLRFQPKLHSLFACDHSFHNSHTRFIVSVKATQVV